MNKDQRLSSAIHILIALDYIGDFLNSQKLAMSLQSNPGFIRRILAQLSKAGLVVSDKRKGGGSKLAKSPAQITICDIYLALGHNRIFNLLRKNRLRNARSAAALKVLWTGFIKISKAPCSNA